MTEPSIRKPTKKAFHFPKNANGDVVAGAEPTKAVASELEDATPAPTKATTQKRAKAVEAGSVSSPSEAKVKPPKKQKLVRDVFTMPESDYAKIAALKQKCLDAGVSVKKSELLRAGLLMLESVAGKRLLAAISASKASRLVGWSSHKKARTARHGNLRDWRRRTLEIHTDLRRPQSLKACPQIG